MTRIYGTFRDVRPLRVRLLNEDDDTAPPQSWDPRKTRAENMGAADPFDRPDEDFDPTGRYEDDGRPDLTPSQIAAQQRAAQQLARQQLAKQGRGGDTEIAHVARGEMVIPQALQNPDVMRALARAAAAHNVPLGQLSVGNARNRINPRTGAPEFWFGEDWFNGLKNGVSDFFGSSPTPGGATAGEVPQPNSPAPPQITPSSDRTIYGPNGETYGQLPSIDEISQNAQKSFEKADAPFQKQVAKTAYLIGAMQDPHVEAGMRLIPRAEGGAVNQWTRLKNGQPQRFVPGIDHPGENDDGQTAAGLFQMQEPTFHDMQKLAGPMNFDEPGQRLAAAALLDKLHALEPLRNGDFNGFLDGASKQWAALPQGPGDLDRTNPRLSMKNTARPYATVNGWYQDYLDQYGGR